MCPGETNRERGVGISKVQAYRASNSGMRLIIVGHGSSGHMGGYLAAAAGKLGISHALLDADRAHARSRLVRSFYWRFRDKRPARLRQFGNEVVDTSMAWPGDVVLTTGCAPLDRTHIERLQGNGIKVINYSTDDPWNSMHSSEWFLSSLPAYDAVFTVRHANIRDFRNCGVRKVYYLPFGYDPDVHKPCTDAESAEAPSDVLFVGGCDSDRLPLIDALINEGINLALFGGYWGRYANVRTYWRGLAGQDTIRAATAKARVCLCLVRRANRDGHTMRTFEAAAIGGCILVEDTADHRELFGPDDSAVRYFSTMPELIKQTKLLLGDSDARHRLSSTLRQTFDRGRHTYAARLSNMLKLVDVDCAS